MKRKILFNGDGVVSTGFSRATHNYCNGLLKAGFEPHLLAINHQGDSNTGLPYPVYSCYPGGDSFGVGRIRDLVFQLRPDAIVIQNDPWNFPAYHQQLEGIRTPVIGIVAIDGGNCQGHLLNWLDFVFFWTKYAEDQARKGGFTGNCAVIPLGVDREIYKQQDKWELKKKYLTPIFERYKLPEDSFVVGTVGRNQARKRFDLIIQYFAEWVRGYDIRDAVLWLHSAPTGDDAYNVKQLAKFFGVSGRVLVPDPNPLYGIEENKLSDIYQLMDVFLSTTIGEGWGLPALEAMSCGTPCILPRWSAYGEWATAAQLISCDSIMVHPLVNTIGGIPNKTDMIAALDHLYHNPSDRIGMRDAGIALASKPHYRWENIGAEFARILDELLTAPSEPEGISMEMEVEEFVPQCRLG